MTALPLGLDFNAADASQQAASARERLHQKKHVLLGYLNQIRAALDLGQTTFTTTCLPHELNWLASELRERQFEVETEVHLMHGQITVSCPA